jgi:SAM-dependent methyltransferase
LIYLTAGTPDIEWFLRSGRLSADSVIATLARGGVDIAEVRAILDFGCGCGRVLRNLTALEDVRLFGTDYNKLLIGWCQANLPLATFSINQLAPPLEYQSSSFDLIYSFSVFTHMPADIQDAWVRELSRLLRPGGHLLISTHGDHYLHHLNADEKARFEAGQLVVKPYGRPGSNSFQAYHPSSYVRDHLTNGLRLVNSEPEGAKGVPFQDLHLLRRD